MLKVLKTCWRGLDFLRRLTLNLVFLLVLGAIVFAFFYEKPVSVPNNAVLLVTLSGRLSKKTISTARERFLPWLTARTPSRVCAT